MKQKIKQLLQNFFIKVFGYYFVKFEKPKPYIDCVKTIEVLLKYYNPKVLCDIGSNNGSWAYTLSNLGQGELKHVTFFEPQSKYQADLQKVEIGQANRVVFPIGLGNEQGELEIKGGNACASFLDFNESNAKDFEGTLLDEKEVKQVKSLDSVYEENSSLPIPDLIKIDVQGFEYKVLQGAQKTLTKSKYVIIELALDTFYKGEARLWEILKFMDENNFRLIDFGFIWRAQYNINNKIAHIDAIFEKS